MTDRTNDDLAERVGELETSLEALRDELQPTPRGPLGLPRPPTPREFLRFADEYAIPAAIAILEAQLRTLELLQRAIRVTEGGRRTRAGGETARDRAAALSRDTLARVEAALEDLQTALEGQELPQDSAAWTILEDARRLNEEIREGLDPAADGSESNGVSIDIEAELESIKDEVEPTDPPDRHDDGEDEG